MHFGIKTEGSFWSNLSLKIVVIAHSQVLGHRTGIVTPLPMRPWGWSCLWTPQRSGDPDTELPSPDRTRGRAYRTLVDRVPGWQERKPIWSFKERRGGAEEFSQLLGGFAAFAEDQSSVPSVLTGWLTATCNPVSEGSTPPLVYTCTSH